jgi:hypothetical protein
VERIRSGQLIEQINQRQKREGEVAFDKGTWGLLSADLSTSIAEQASLSEALSQTSPCEGIPSPAASAPEAQRAEALRAFGACTRELSGRGFLLMRALTSFKTFVPSEGLPPLHAMSDEELKRYLSGPEGRHPLNYLGQGHAVLERLRTSYSMDEQEALLNLVQARRAAFLAAQGAIFRVMERHLGWLESFVGNNRYATLLAMQRLASDPSGRSLMAALTEISSLRPFLPRTLNGLPTELLYPYALLAVVPDEGDELKPLSPGENPFENAFEMIFELEGPEARVQNTLLGYNMFSIIDNPRMPFRDAPHSEAARVAVIDSGADWRELADLGLFLAGGGPGEQSSQDFTDRDTNPWMPAIGPHSHGSGVMATVLTIVARQQPEVLRQNKLDVAMWKLGTVRSLLSGAPFVDSHRFDIAGLYSLFHGIRTEVARSESPGAISPHMVSMSLGFPTWRNIDREGFRDVLIRAPWLWVMAAGNSGKDVMTEKRSCFADVPSEFRPTENLLCVGALERGIVRDQIRAYSNFGDSVDVYTYESFTEHCPNGTSCATPAITGAAAILKARFPALTSAQLKQAIVGASETREIRVEARETPSSRTANGATPTERRRVKFFDPTTMMDRALAEAQRWVATTAVPVSTMR